jgi:hypothetical protein
MLNLWVSIPSSLCISILKSCILLDDGSFTSPKEVVVIIKAEKQGVLLDLSVQAMDA